MSEAAPVRRGLYVVVAGPDGTGKTTVAQALLAGPLRRAGTLHLHHRPHVLGALSRHEGPVTQPHRHDPYPPWLSLAKVGYLYLDFAVGWWLRLRPALRRGGHVVMERGWWDIAIDPRRYRLRAHRLTSLLGRLLPRPDVTVVLGGPAEAILARSGELPEPELRRQLHRWQEVSPTATRPVHVDVSKPLEQVTRSAVDAVTRPPGRQRWVGLPNPAAPRWWLPVDGGAVSRGGMLVYTPVTTRGLVGWSLGRAVAGVGALRLLPQARVGPPQELLERLAPHLPPGGFVAVARATHANRLAVILLDADGRPHHFAKVALDREGRTSLAEEAAAVTRLGAHCQPPLHVPAVHHQEDGLLLFEAVRWRPRHRPWLLSPAVACALGTLFASGRREDGSGPAHGDFAPWNLLLDRDGQRWWLIDWAQARDRAPAFFDPLHHIVQSCALLRRPRIPEVVAALRGEGPLGRSLAAYAAAAGVSLEEASPAVLAYLDQIPRCAVDAPRTERRAAAVRAALRAAVEATPGR